MKILVFASTCLLSLPGLVLAQDASAVIAGARKALGDPRSITYAGTAKDVAFQQCGANAAAMTCQGVHDPMRPITSYVRVIDLAAPASRHSGGTTNVGGGGSTTVVPGTFFQQVTPQQADLSQPWATSLEFYITPWGFLKGAAENNATASRRRMSGRRYTVLSWSPRVKAPSGKNYVVNGYVADDGLIERVETWVGDNLMGDMHVVATYTGWKDFGGAKAPSRIVQTRGGWPFFEVDITTAKTDPADLDTLALAPAGRGAAPGAAPAAGAGRGGPGGPAAPPALTVTSETLGEGVYRLTTGTGSYDSLVVDFRDHIMMLEAGQNEARALAYIAEAKRLVPGKPIRYVMNTHAHADHTGGLPALVAEGATLITHKNNEAFFTRALNTPRTLLNDTLASRPRKVKIRPVSERKIYSDGTRRVELYHIYPAPHSNGLLVAYLPREKVLFQGDFSLPAAGQPANDHVKALVPALEKLNLDFERYINVHASATPQTKAELWKAVGK